MPEADIAAARSPIGRARKGSPAGIRPNDLMPGCGLPAGERRLS